MKINRKQIGTVAVILTLTTFRHISKETKMKIVLVLAIVSFVLMIIYILKNRSIFKIKMCSMTFLGSLAIYGNYYNDLYIFNKYYSGISVLIVIFLVLLLMKVLLDNIWSQGDIQKYRKTKVQFLFVTLAFFIFSVIIMIGMFK
ncbi:hypothetical protein [Clostridium thailandense]|uniref:hypothetical protein n=1 Tax=Clostridium thailandense TaxID=2794346 RepID=UPI003989CCFB